MFVVYCGDTVDNARETTTDVFEAIHRVTVISTSRAVERLPTRINKKPMNVVLMIGNTGDPITPFQSTGRLASAIAAVQCTWTWSRYTELRMCD
ncbi:hypothetical protein SIIN_4185_T [Serendipita indica DSM 11827]|nr:hypothetical protein SIIN_4185_T [Serendipita indica DSM 11827]